MVKAIKEEIYVIEAEEWFRNSSLGMNTIGYAKGNSRDIKKYFKDEDVTLKQTVLLNILPDSAVVTNNTNRTMLTDLYQLTMNAAYFDNNKDDVATFDMFIRKLPKDWGYFIANGIEDVVDYITNLKFEKDDIDYLKSQNRFSDDFLKSLENFKFEGDVYAVKEGTPMFPNEPILRITAKRSQAQYVESALLNMINFQTLIASKASRVVNAAAPGIVVDFGLRRAQEYSAAMTGSRACYIGGAIATSNVMAGKEYGIPISGTHAHSYVMSFEEEIDAFRAYVKTFPDNATLLIDTYDTVEGAKKAAIVAKELESQGHKLGAVRLDSGDLTDLSIKVRKIFDDLDLEYIRVFASNDLNEYEITTRKEDGSRIDGYGVGTEMITAKPVAALSGVYKLVEDEQGPKIKLSKNKQSLPGKKQIYRQEVEGKYVRDIIAFENENTSGKALLEKVVSGGNRISERRSLDEIRTYSLGEVAKLSDDLKQVQVSNHYQIEIAPKLKDLIQDLTQKYGGQ